MFLHKINTFNIRQALLFALGAAVLCYAVVVLAYVGSSYEIGIRSILSTQVAGNPVGIKPGDPPLQSGDTITRVGDKKIVNWSDLLQAPDELHRELENVQSLPNWCWDDLASGRRFVAVQFLRDQDGRLASAFVELRRLPADDMIPSLIWLLLKGSLFVIGAVVYWKRPGDESALRFYILCVVTLGAYIGGYHWTQIVTQPVLSIIFNTCAVLLPVASLHFYLVFPRKKLWLQRYPRRTLAAVYGVPLTNLAGLIGLYLYIRWCAGPDSAARHYMVWLIYASFGIAMLWYLACSLSLMHSMFTVQDPMERKQVKCISVGIFFSLFPIGHSLYIVLAEPARFIEGAVTWPMFAASAIVTFAFAIGMTRYRLMELDKIINSGVGYFLVSFLAGLMYYGVVFVGTLFYNRFVSSPTLPAALTVSTTALIFVLVLDAARRRLQLALDRRLSRSKSQLDQTLQEMSQAVSQLVDPHALAQRFLTAAADTLGVTRGAIYLRHDEPAGYRLAAHLGPAPPAQELPADAPLIQAMQSGLGLEAPPPAESAPSPAQRQLLELNAEAAQPLQGDGKLLAVMILGPRDGPFRPDDWNLLSAFAQITSVALEGAAQHRTIERLNQDLQAKVDKIAEQQRRILTLQSQLYRQAADDADRQTVPAPPESRPASDAAPAVTIPGIVGSSPVVQQLLSVVRKVAVTDAVVLLRGESGTGKELLARAVHDTSPRAEKPYVKVHCAALSANLLESELFGHVKGAFTGAHRDKIGRFELAGGGTLFLDEIGDISLEVQTKLLRVLQEKTIERVGSSDPLKVDVRIIAATHQNLEELIRQGRFREDLFYRLNVFPIIAPPLRARREDIAELAVHFIAQSARRCKKSVTNIDDDALALLKSHPWPGNIRQLENVIERAVVIAEREILTLHDMPPEMFNFTPRPVGTEGVHVEPAPAEEPADKEPAKNGTLVANLRSQRDRFEREQLLRALGSAGGNKSEAARILGIARSTLMSRLKKFGLD